MEKEDILYKLTINQAKEEIGVSGSTIMGWIKKDYFKAKQEKTGNRVWRIDVYSFYEFKNKWEEMKAK